MPRPKTKLLAGNFLYYHLDDIEQQMRALLKKTQEPTPPDMRHFVTLLVMFRHFPELSKDPSPGADRTRSELVRFITEFPEHAIAGLQAVYRKPEINPSASAVVREFLLMQLGFETRNGKWRTTVGATDGEIAMAAEDDYKRKTGRRIQISEKVVKDERHRLERKYGEPISEVAKVYAYFTQVPHSSPSRSRRRLMQQILANFYS